MMQNQLLLAAALVLFSATFTLADDNAPTRSEKENPSGTSTAEKRWEYQEGPNGPILKEVESIRQQLGPEYSIESKELGIERDRDATKPSKSDQPDEEWNGTKLYQQVRELVQKFRQDARHLEEMAAHAEQLSEFALADQLREMAHRQWEAARELSQPRSTRGYRDPGQPVPTPPKATLGNPPTPYPVMSSSQLEAKPPQPESPPESAVPYGVPSAPKQRFSFPSEPEPRKRYP